METTTYTLAQLIELANTGACAFPQERKNDGVCADKTDTAFFDPSKLKPLACKKLRFKVQNKNAAALYLGFGAFFNIPGLDPLAPKSTFFGSRGVDAADFFVGDTNIPIATGMNALAAQSFMYRCPRTIARSLEIVNVSTSDAIIANDVIVEKFNCGTGKCDDNRYSSTCGVCATGNSNINTYRYDLGLTAADERDSFGIEIPAAPANPDLATIYTIDVEVAFHVGAYGYVAGCGA